MTEQVHCLIGVFEKAPENERKTVSIRDRYFFFFPIQ